ncbi:MAG TPA: RDD family protein [Phycisphaerae bacterium]|nr:RDD family protein [Phycisphaerae bacterium]
MNQLVGPVFDYRDYAGFWRRSIALVIDFLILIIIYLCAAEYWYDLVPESWWTATVAANIEFGLFLFVLAYLFLFRLTQGGTPGYRLVRIRYAHMFNEKPTMLQRSYRAAITMFMIWGLFVIDHFWILFDERKQTWHDKVSGFYVVKCKARPMGTQQVVQRIVNFMMLSLVVWEPKGLARPVVCQSRD